MALSRSQPEEPAPRDCGAQQQALMVSRLRVRFLGVFLLNFSFLSFNVLDCCAFHPKLFRINTGTLGSACTGNSTFVI
jgi:hypothetical protein